MSIVDGVVIGIVTDVQPGQVKLNFPWLDSKHETDWVRVATLMSGGGRGSCFMPEINDEVLVGFEHGDTRFPYVVGFLWNGQDKPPSDDVRDRKLMSKNGHSIRFLDSTPVAGSKGALVIEDAHGNRITMSSGKVLIQSKHILEIEAQAIYLTGPELAPNSDGVTEKAWRRRILANNNTI